VVNECWLALVYDVLALGYGIKDMFTTLGLAEMIAIAVAAPPTTAVFYWVNGGWTREAQLIASGQEQAAGIAKLTEPYARPGIESRPPPDPVENAKWFPADALDWQEAERRDAQRYQAAREGRIVKRRPTRVRTF
jgi:hypothetical protein